MAWVPLSNNRWGLEINYVPVTIGVADAVYYEEIYSTIEAFKLNWGVMANNYVIYFSNQADFVKADDPVWNDYNQSSVYTFQTIGSGIYTDTLLNGIGYGETAPYGELSYKGEIGTQVINNYVERARKLIVEQFEEADQLLAMIDSHSDESQELEYEIYNTLIMRQLKFAVGEQLDGVGSIVGELRNGRSDDEYRVGINFRIYQNKSYGEANVISGFLSQNLGGDYYDIKESFPAGLDIQIEGTALDNAKLAIFQSVDKIVAGGVSVHGSLQDTADSSLVLQCIEVGDDGSGDSVVPDAPLTGGVLEGNDGSYITSDLTAGKTIESISF